MFGRPARSSLFCLCAIALGATALAGGGADAAEIYYLDRDAFSDQYVGPVGPLVLSGEIVPGDYAQLLSRIAADQKRFLDENKLILASSEGNAEEAMKIARLVQSLYTSVSVGPLTGRCAGACFLIYAAAAERGTDGENLLGVSRPGLAESQWAAMPTAEAALLEDGMQAAVRTFLSDNEVPPDIVEEMFARPPTDIHWLSEEEERALSPRSPAFAKFLKDKCGWSEELERTVYLGQLDGLKKLTDCRSRTTQPEARKSLAQALKDSQLPGAATGAGTSTAAGKAAPSKPSPAAKKKSVSRARRAESKTSPSSSEDPRSH